jgi:hypothetical protein
MASMKKATENHAPYHAPAGSSGPEAAAADIAIAHAEPEHLAPIWARHRVVHLFLRLTIYYVAVTTIACVGTWLFPGVKEYLPLGGAQSLLGDVSKKDPFTAIETNALQISSLAESLVWICIAIIASVLTILPVSWTYMSIRKRSDYDQSLVETIMVLPVAVTCLVILVHNSVALAFSLGGIVAVVRFRNTLESTGDALYILMAIGVGLAAGVGAMEVAIAMSMAFNYGFLLLWITDYGGHRGTRRYMRRARKPVLNRKRENDRDDDDGDDE